MATKILNRIAGAAFAAALGLAVVPAHADGGAIWTTEATGSVVHLPATLAYGAPDPEAVHFSDSGVTDWSDARESLIWYGELKHGGAIDPTVTVQLPAGETATLRFTAMPGGAEKPRVSEAESVTVTVTGTGAAAPVTFPEIKLPGKGGWTRFTLLGLKKSGATFGDVDSVSLGGPAIVGAFFNTTHYRSTASVHLGYHPSPETGAIDAFYNEVTARRDPVVTYYCAIGWNRGYMGYQVNGPHERRIIFSVWDAGNEKLDKNAVAQKDRAEWIAHGPGVVTDRFGGEGTGGHSHLVYPWHEGDAYRFLVTSQPDGPDHLIYAGYFFFPDKRAWGLIGKIRTPVKTPGKSAEEAPLTGLYSFDEDFSGAAGDKLRMAEFGPQWAHGADGNWHEVTDAHFSNTDRKHEQRDDYDAYPTDNGEAFVLATGGYVPPRKPIEYGDRLKRTGGKGVPADLDGVLKDLPKGIPTP